MSFSLNVSAGRFVLFFTCTLMIACGPGRKAGKKRVALNEVTVTAKNNPNNIYRATTDKAWEIVHTRVALSFDYKAKTANGKTWLKLHPYFYAADSLRLDAKDMDVDSVIWMNAGQKTVIPVVHKDAQLLVKFNRAISSSETIELYIKYTAKPYSGQAGGSAAINDDKGLYFINTDNAVPGKPVQVWTQGETESNSHWMPTIDKPNQRTTTQIELTVADSFTTLSNGVLAKQVPQANGMRTDTWVMDKPIQVYAIMFAIGKFSVMKDNEWQGREVSYYVEPQYAPYAKDIFMHTPEMIDFFSKFTGVPYPWNKYSQVVVRDYVSGAMENTTATLLGEFMNQDRREHADKNNEDVVSHELFHQWFGDYVTAESWSNLTVNESFANYGEQLWRMYKHGKASADELYWTDLHVYLNSGQSTLPLVRFYYSDKEQMFDRVSYQKGGAILHYLHGLAGDEAFSAAMQRYLTTNALKPAEATQWRLAIEDVTGKDWTWFFNQWYNRPGHPRLEIKYNYDDASLKLNVNIAQVQEGQVFRLPLKSALVYGNDKTILDWDIAERNTILSYPYKNGIRPVIIPDVQHWLVGEMSENKKPAEWLTVFKNSEDDIIDKFKALSSIKNKWDDTANISIVNMALHDKEHAVRSRVLGVLEGVTQGKLQDKWKSDVRYIADNDGNNLTRAAAINVLGTWNIKEAKAGLLEALHDSSYAVAGAALDALGRIAPDTVYTLAKQLTYTNPRADLDAAIWEVIGEKAKEDDIILFEQQAPYYYGTKKIDLASSLGDYLQHTGSASSFNRGLDVFLAMVRTEVISSYRVAIASYLMSTAIYYRDKKKTARTNPDLAVAENRLALIKPVLEKMAAEETNEDSRSSIKNYITAIYGN